MTGRTSMARPVRIFLSLLYIATILMLIGCGGGGGNTPPPPVTPITSATETINSTGGSIVTPTQNVTVALSPNSLSTNTQITVDVYDKQQIQQPLNSMVEYSNVVGVTGVSSINSGGAITVTAPYSGTTDRACFSLLSDNAGNTLPIIPQLNIAAHTFTVTVQPSDLSALPIAGRGTRGLAGWTLSLVGIPEITETASAILRRFNPSVSTPPAKGDHSCWLPSDADSWNGQRIAIVIHGIRNDYTNMNPLAYYLAKDLTDVYGQPVYSRVYSVDYNWKAHINENAELLVARINSHLPIGGATNIDVYGHSMGGLVARYAIEDGNIRYGTKRLFALAAPNNGVPLRALAKVVTALGRDGAFDMSYPGVRDLVNGWDFLNGLNDSSQHTGGGVRYYTFAGNHWKGYLSTVGAAVHVAYFGDDNNMDGIVPVSSAQYSGLASKCQTWVHPSERYNCDHGQMGGEYTASGFSLDHATSGDSTIDRPEWRTAAHKPLKYFILNTGEIDTTID